MSRKLRVLTINTSDISGGAARAAYRLHNALLEQGIDSNMLVQSKKSDDFTVDGPDSFLRKAMVVLRPQLDKLPVKCYRNRTKPIFSAAWLPLSGIGRRINALSPDIIHLHWIAGGMVRIEDIAKIQKPIVWSLHDMWAFTGGCHYDEGCGKYQAYCCACPALGSGKNKDLSRWIFRRKAKHFSKVKDLTINGLSKWLADCAESSHLFQGRKVVNLPNPIDTEMYKPMPKDQAKQILGLSRKKIHLLFGAMNAAVDDRKGFSELVQALKHVTGHNIELAVFGSNEPEDAPCFPFPAQYLGRLQDDISLRILYSAADVMIVPSRQENLSNVILESLACGTPVVGFDIGGNKDMIDHLTNGYLATPFEPEDLAKGIKWIFEHPNPHTLSHNARGKVVREFDSKVVAKKYIELYEEMLAQK